MKQLFSERFKSARMLNGLSLQNLADKLENKVSRQALHKYEKGLVMPDGAMLILLSNALNVRPDFLLRDTKIELAEVEFRKLKKLSAKEENRIIEEVKDKLSRYLELEEFLSIQTRFENPLKGMEPVNSFEQVEAAAQKVRKAWDLGNDPISNSIELLEDKHIKVVEINVGDNFDGMQTWVNNDIPVIAINKENIKSDDRVRFTAFHELAHLLLPLKHLPEKQKEKFCHQFAAAMLLPGEAAIDELGKHRSKLMIQELGLIKKQYGISIQTIVMRARDLEIISNSYCKQFFFLMQQMGWKQEEPSAYKNVEESNRFDQLLLRALAEEIISISKAASLRNQKLAEFREKFLIVS